MAKERFNATTYKAIFQHADDVFDANRLGATSAAPVVAAVSATQDLNETQPALQYPVAAASFRGGARGRGRGGGSNRGKPQQPSKGEAPKPSPDSSLPPNLGEGSNVMWLFGLDKKQVLPDTIQVLAKLQMS